MSIKIGRAAIGEKFLRNGSSEGDGHVYTVLDYVPPGVEFDGRKRSYGRYVAESYYSGDDDVAFRPSYYLKGARMYQESQP